ncbi:MAG: hypothetical protein ABIU09_11970 [Pyrinomonadaceae bacterium]
MATVFDDEGRLKEVLKSAIIEVLQERKELVREILASVVEDVAFSKAIEEGERTPLVDRGQIFELLESPN